MLSSAVTEDNMARAGRLDDHLTAIAGKRNVTVDFRFWPVSAPSGWVVIRSEAVIPLQSQSCSFESSGGEEDLKSGYQWEP